MPSGMKVRLYMPKVRSYGFKFGYRVKIHSHAANIVEKRKTEYEMCFKNV